jgi:hypothetical protein
MKGLVQGVLGLVLSGCMAAHTVSAKDEKAKERPVQNQTAEQSGAAGNEAGPDMAAMISGQQELVGKMLDAMREMARLMREETTNPEIKSEAAKMVNRIDQLKDQQQLMLLAMKTPAKPAK